MDLKLYNTMTREKEVFKPLSLDKDENGRQVVKMYTCGPTVYDYAHIGNFRAMVNYDLIKRTFIMNDLDVNHVMNITDVDDKTIRGSNGSRKDFYKLVKKYEDAFWSDLTELNFIKPGVVTHATDYIDKIVDFILILLEKGYAYKAADGSTYFSISKFSEYGKLSRLDNQNLIVGARVVQDEYSKENLSDFALWKAWSEKDGEVYWDTKLGRGRPGWHIECSAMSADILGDTLDVHAGGVDLLFPHHENEIAQSEARSGKKFVDMWLHNEHLLVDGRKMSKSLNNFYTLANIKSKGFSGIDLRYFMFGAHYRSTINFTWESLEASRSALRKLYSTVIELKRATNTEDEGKQSNSWLQKFQSTINDDLNTPQALAATWEMLRDQDLNAADKIKTVLAFDNLLGFNIQTMLRDSTTPIPENVSKIVTEREVARNSKDWTKADELRAKIEDLGYLVRDTEAGQIVDKRV
ncbi:MAG: cysteine--tRNA ligase [Candidatus Vogelbacteria bacterium]|nr:cysteine--tRNA ligase [Candidatus Vogelbacteria bacterium]